MSLLLAISRNSSEVLTQELVLICRMLLDVYNHLGMKKEGSLSGQVLVIGEEIDSKWLGVPKEVVFLHEPVCRIPSVEDAEQLRLDPIETLCNRYDWLHPIRVPLLAKTIDYPLDPDSLRSGDTIVLGSHRWRGLLIAMDVIKEQEVMMVDIETEVEFMYFRERLRDPSFSVVSFYDVVRDFPEIYLPAFYMDTSSRPRTWVRGPAKSLLECIALC